MFSKVLAPVSLVHEELDNYLSIGWFRMGQSLFTTNFLNFKNQFYSAVWLRSDLKEFEPDSTFKKLKKMNAGLKVIIQPLDLTSEKETLFFIYRESIQFDASESIQHLLFSNKETEVSVFDTFEVCLYDNQQLVATGFFDMGKTAAAGISSFYHPTYKKKSLGKYLIYLKMEYCKQKGLNYFYPGYFVPGYSSFDYKLSIGTNSLSFLSFKKNEWIHTKEFSAQYDVYRIMHDKLIELKNELDKQNSAFRLFNYEYFQANMVLELSTFNLFDYPQFLCNAQMPEDIVMPVLVYDILDEEYKLLECRSVWQSFDSVDKPDTFADHLLKVNLVLFSTPEVLAMAQKLLQ